MNCLNSIIVEGEVHNVCLTKVENDVSHAEFKISTSRFYKDSTGEEHEEISLFEVFAYGRLAEFYKKQSEEKRGIRIVGRIKQIRCIENDKTYSKLVIIAEHIEFKPKKVNKEN